MIELLGAWAPLLPVLFVALGGLGLMLVDALVKDKSYTLASTGADARGGRRLPYPFAYTIRTSDLTPKQAVAAEDDKSVAPAKQGGGS